MKPNDIATTKDAALRAVGRTVVNFQRLEHNLKVAARLGPVEGVAAKIQNDIKHRSEKAQGFTLGQAVAAWLSVVQNDQAPVARTPDLFDETMHMSFSLELSAEDQASHAKALIRLKEYRNSLFHGRLVRFDWESPTECSRLIEELEEVNAGIAVQLEFVAGVLKSLQEMGENTDLHIEDR